MSGLTRTPGGADWGIEQILFPRHVEEFLTQYWQRQPLHISGRDPEWFSDLFSIDEIEAAMPVVERTPLMLRIANRRLHASSDDRDLYARYLNGDAIVVNHVHRRSPALNIFCRRMEDVFHFPVGANAYVTPPRAKGFGRHYDKHDVFALQIEGHKEWDIWPAVYSLPLADTNAVVPHEPPEPPRTIVLSPGDTLYVPRGFVHEVIARDDPSLHISVSISAFTWLDFLSAALRVAASADERLRTALPVGYLGDRELLDRMFRQELRQPMHSAMERVAVDDVCEALSRELAAWQSEPLDGHFRSIQSVANLVETTIVKKRPGMVCFVRQGTSEVCLLFSGRVSRAPLVARAAFEFIAATEVFPVAGIPGLDGPSQVLLVRRLVADGLLQVVE